MKIYDVTRTIDEQMMIYKNNLEKQPSFKATKSHAIDGFKESTITIDVHTGTHLDAPCHMKVNGDTIDQLSIEQLISPCRVIDFSHLKCSITESHLAPYVIAPDEFLIFKTRNSLDKSFNPEFIYLSEDGARYLVKQGIKGVGTDGLGIERSQPGHPTHHALFDAGIYVLEGLALENIPAGNYELIALPLKLKGLDASPVRAVLVVR